METCSLISALLYALCWISVSDCQFHTVEVHPGDQVTLWCSNLSSYPAHVYWFKLTNQPNASCISSMFSSDSNNSLRDGFSTGKFAMTSNGTNVSLRIKQVNVSDSGLYFCGFYFSGHPGIFGATYLRVEAEVFNKSTVVLIVMLAALTISLIMVVICLIAKIRTIQTDQDANQSQEQRENLDSDAVTYTALRFHLKSKSSSRPDGELETNAVHAATR